MASNRICYFKNQNPGAGLDEQQNATLTSLSNALALKADASDLSNYALAADLSSKADSSSVYTKSQVDTALAGKANSSALSDYALAADLTSLESDVAEKVSQSYVDSALAAKLDESEFNTAATKINEAFNALGDAIYVESSAGSGVEFDWSAHNI